MRSAIQEAPEELEPPSWLVRKKRPDGLVRAGVCSVIFFYLLDAYHKMLRTSLQATWCHQQQWEQGVGHKGIIYKYYSCDKDKIEWMLKPPVDAQTSSGCSNLR